MVYQQEYEETTGEDKRGHQCLAVVVTSKTYPYESLCFGSVGRKLAIEYPAICDWAKELGVDDVFPQLPYYGKDLSPQPLPKTVRSVTIYKNQLSVKRRRICPVGRSVLLFDVLLVVVD